MKYLLILFLLLGCTKDKIVNSNIHNEYSVEKMSTCEIRFKFKTEASYYNVKIIDNKGEIVKKVELPNTTGLFAILSFVATPKVKYQLVFGSRSGIEIVVNAGLYIENMSFNCKEIIE